MILLSVQGSSESSKIAQVRSWGSRAGPSHFPIRVRRWAGRGTCGSGRFGLATWPWFGRRSMAPDVIGIVSADPGRCQPDASSLPARGASPSAHPVRPAYANDCTMSKAMCMAKSMPMSRFVSPDLDGAGRGTASAEECSTDFRSMLSCLSRLWMS